MRGEGAAHCTGIAGFCPSRAWPQCGTHAGGAAGGRTCVHCRVVLQYLYLHRARLRVGLLFPSRAADK